MKTRVFDFQRSQVSGSQGANFTAGGREHSANRPREAGDSVLVKTEGQRFCGLWSCSLVVRGHSLIFQIEFRLCARNSLVSTVGNHVEAETANSCLSYHEFSVGELKSDLALFFRVFGFENRGVAFNPRNAAALAGVGGWSVSIFVFENAEELDLQLLLAERPDFQFVAPEVPGTVDLRRGHIALCMHRQSHAHEKREQDKTFLIIGA